MAATKFISALSGLNLEDTLKEGDNFHMNDISDGPCKRADLSGTSAGSDSPFPNSESPPPQRSKAYLNSTPYGTPSDVDDSRSNAVEPKDESFNIGMQPMSQEELVASVKGVYTLLVTVEAKCKAKRALADRSTQPKLNNKEWQKLIAWHQILLDRYYDFFSFSQHPSASPALRQVASKNAMPAKMWRYGIHPFLELLRHCLPASWDYMLTFIYFAYSMVTLLYETVQAFEDIWIECLGDLGRYRMAIEDDNICKEVWTGVARRWYSKALDEAPTNGRLYHHLAILARPNVLQQLFYYSKSLCVVEPFTSTHESILRLFDPVLNAEKGQGQYRLPPLDTAFVKAHGLLFTDKEIGTRFEAAVNEILGLLNNQIGRVTRKFMEQGFHIAIINSVALLGFASPENELMKAISPSQNDGDIEMGGTSSNNTTSLSPSFKLAQHLNKSTLSIVLQRIGDPNVLPFIHTTLVFMSGMSRHTGAMSIVGAEFPWELLSVMLNTLLVSCETTDSIENDTFPSLEEDDARPLPEDFALRGLLWAENYFPAEWFNNQKIDEEEKYHEHASITTQRKERILWLAVRIARNAGCGLDYDSGKADKTNPKFSPCVEPFASASKASTFESIAPRTTLIDR